MRIAIAIAGPTLLFFAAGCGLANERGDDDDDDGAPSAVLDVIVGETFSVVADDDDTFSLSFLDDDIFLQRDFDREEGEPDEVSYRCATYDVDEDDRVTFSAGIAGDVELVVRDDSLVGHPRGTLSLDEPSGDLAERLAQAEPCDGI